MGWVGGRPLPREKGTVMMPFEISSSLFSANFLGNPGETFSFLSVDHRGAGKKRRESKSLEERKKVTTARSLVFPVVPKFRDFGKVRLPAGKRPRPPFFNGWGTKEEEGRKSASAISLRSDDDSQRRRRSSFTPLTLSPFPSCERERFPFFGPQEA